MTGWIVFWVIVLIAALAAGAEVYRELHHFRITRYSVRSEKLAGLARDVKILFLSDLHDRTYGKDNVTLLESIRSQSPDLILIGGDMLVGKENASCDNALALIRELPKICPVICANGNHEQRLKDDPETYGDVYEKYKKALEGCGVHLLENESIRVELGPSDLVIYGLELPSASYKKFKKSPLTSREISEYFGQPESKGDQCRINTGKREETCYKILLAHNPAYMDAYLDWGADMVLSGHLHGGLVRVPGLGGIVTPQGFLFPKYSGEMTQEGNQTVIVSRGLGTHTLNIRLFNTPELIALSLSGSLSGK